MSEQRVRNVPTSPPPASSFNAFGGTPVVIALNEGRLWVLRDDGVPVDCLLLSNDSVWDDLRFPAQGINPAGAVAPPTVDTTLTDFPGTLLFSGSQINVIAGVAQMPHSWEYGSAIQPHIHWSKTTSVAGAVSWQFKWRKASIGAAFGAWSAWLDGIASVMNGAGATTDTHYMTAFPGIAMTGDGRSTIINWQVQRVGTTDAYNSDARLFEFDIHYQINKLGSITE